MKKVEADEEYIKKLHKDHHEIVSKTECLTPLPKLPLENSEVKFQGSSGSSDSCNSKVSTNDQAKTPLADIKVSPKKAKVNRTAMATRKSTAKKSLRIRKRSKPRAPMLTKQSTSQNTYVFEPSRKLQSSERSKRRKVREVGTIKKMYSEEQFTPTPCKYIYYPKHNHSPIAFYVHPGNKKVSLF